MELFLFMASSIRFAPTDPRNRWKVSDEAKWGDVGRQHQPIPLKLKSTDTKVALFSIALANSIAPGTGEDNLVPNLNQFASLQHTVISYGVVA